MLLKDLLKAFDPEIAVQITRPDNFTIIVTKAASWRYLDDALLNSPVDFVDGKQQTVLIRLATYVPVYVSTADELQTAINDGLVHAVALAADINAEDDVPVLLSFNNADIKSIDLNGHLLGASMGEQLETVAAIKVAGGGTLNIYDSDGCGEIDGGRSSNINYGIWITEGSSVNLYGGGITVSKSITNQSAAVFIESGTMAVYGGYLQNAYYNGDTAVAFAGDGFIFYGGTVKNQDPSEYLAMGKYSKKFIRNYEVFYRIFGK